MCFFFFDESGFDDTSTELRCVELRQPHSCKRRTKYFFCYTHHVYSQGGPNFVLVMSFVAPLCGLSFSSSHAHDLFLVKFSHGSRPRRRHTAGGRYGYSILCPHPFKSSEFVRATGRDPHPQRGRQRTANLANPRSLSESTTPGAV